VSEVKVVMGGAAIQPKRGSSSQEETQDETPLVCRIEGMDLDRSSPGNPRED
jgi:hypothetical protein